MSGIKQAAVLTTKIVRFLDKLNPLFFLTYIQQKQSQLQPHRNEQQHVPHISHVPVYIHFGKSKTHLLRVLLKDWLPLPQFCPFYDTKEVIYTLQVPSAAFWPPYTTSHRHRRYDALTQQTARNSQCSLQKQQLPGYPETLLQITSSTALQSRAPRHQRDITSAGGLPAHYARQQGEPGAWLSSPRSRTCLGPTEKTGKQTERAPAYTCASQKNAYVVLSELSALPCFPFRRIKARQKQL